jgi:Flp pilus assembly protein TadD
VKCLINLAEVHTALDQPVEAEAALAKVVGTSGLTAEDLSNLGIVLMKMRRPERALQVLAAATTMEPTSPTHLYNLANALAAVGRFDEAEAAFRRCISLAPASPAPTWGSASCWRRPAASPRRSTSFAPRSTGSQTIPPRSTT